MAISRGEIKWVKALHSKKGRKEFKCFIAEGKKCVAEALQSGLTIRKIYSCEPSALETDSALQISENEMAQITSLATPSPHLAVIEIPDVAATSDLLGKIIILDQISDPGNAGTIIRTAEWFGISGVIMMENSVEWSSPKVVQSSMGSVFRIKILQLSLPQLTQFLSTRKGVLGADLRGQPAESVQWPEVDTLIIGSESHGISAGVKSLCNRLVTIPRHGQAESLNAAVAAGILMSRWAS